MSRRMQKATKNERPKKNPLREAFYSMTVKELCQNAKRFGIKGYSKMKKEQLQKLIMSLLDGPQSSQADVFVSSGRKLR
jgi:hypothetical protein